MRYYGLAAAFVIGLVVSGCESTKSGTGQGEHLSSTQRLVIPDIPVPDGFKMDLEHSFYNSSAGMRTGYVTYTGRASMPALVEFYKDNMPISGWALTNESSSSGSYVLRYDKNAEQVDIKITPGRVYTDILVSFWPKGSKKK